MYGAHQGDGVGPIVLVPGGLVLDAAKGGCWFSVGCPWHTWLFLAVTWSALIEKWCRQDYFLRRQKAGRLRPSSKSVPLSRSGPCSSVGWCSKVVHQNPHQIWCCARSGWWPWCSKKLHQNPHPGRLMFSFLRRWGGVPKVGVVFQKSCPRIPTLYTSSRVFKFAHFRWPRKSRTLIHHENLSNYG